MENFLNESVGDQKSLDSLTEKLRYQTVLLDPAHKPPKPVCSTHPRPRALSTREKRKLRLHDIPPEKQRYDDFLPLHQLWLGYMDELLQVKTATSSSSAAKR